jgi:hydrogenase expression/formation protein HypC
MCLAIPALVKGIEGTTAQVDINGIGRTCSVLLTPSVKVGDYVLIHTGYAIEVLNEEEARETLQIFEEAFAKEGGEA